MNFYEFAGSHPLLTLMLIYLMFSPVRYAFKAYNRFCRSRNIAAAGWPPSHLDADGDFKSEN